jgi:hypothetical protein
MKLKNIYKDHLFKKIAFLGLVLGLIMIAIIINDNELQDNFLYSLYLIVGLASFGIGYMEIASTVKLGFGITRIKIFKNFTSNQFVIVGLLLLLNLLYNFMIYFIKDYPDLWKVLNLKMTLFLSFLIILFGQLGMLFGNVKINKYLGTSIFLIMFIFVVLEIYVLNNKLFINIIVGLISIILMVVNYCLIKNIKIERG